MPEVCSALSALPATNGNALATKEGVVPSSQGQQKRWRYICLRPFSDQVEHAKE
jgi:hypothetical protein